MAAYGRFGMNHPGGLAFVLLLLAAFRLTRLVGWDDLTRRPRAWLCGMGDVEYERVAELVDGYEAEGLDAWQRRERELPPRRRFYLAKLIHCPWCVGFWISAVVWLAWLAWPDGTVGVAVPFALSAGVGLIARNGDP